MQELFFKTHGNRKNPSLLLLHGFAGSHMNFRALEKYLKDFFYIYLIDLRNHGHSFMSDDMTYESMSQDIENIIEIHKIENSIIVGHSMGGKIAMTLGLLHHLPLSLIPSHLFILDIAPIPYEIDLSPYTNILQSIPLSKITKRQDLEERLKESIASESIRALLMQNLKKNEDNTFQWRFQPESLPIQANAIAKFPDTSNVCNIPTIFIQSDPSDYYCPQRDLPMIKKFFTKHKIYTLKNTSHWIHGDAPEKITQIIQENVQNLAL